MPLNRSLHVRAGFFAARQHILPAFCGYPLRGCCTPSSCIACLPQHLGCFREQ
nr:MAG TPA: hypothetical protein [Caudoviricetes sp.]